ncbi:MAG TPA: TetR/AcrR family transcriptional regulator [Mobilitalea sp.]|nr:TetR/AcrR family transcriptional regulator [Mobilitalea sp.]
MNLEVNQNIQKRRRGIETTQKIMETAAKLFAKQGYDGVAVRTIAEAVGIKESSLYNHFRSKADILDALFDHFIRMVPQTRPSEEELDQMLAIMQPEEIFKNIVFHVGSHISDILANTAMIINLEKYRNPRAAEMYYKYVVNEPADYYERMIHKMMERELVKPVDARMFAEQYNYVSIALTKEYFMAKNGYADIQSVVKYMVKTLTFFCELMKKQ